MGQNDLLKRYLDAGVAFTHLTQAKAEEIVRDLVKAGEVQTEDARKRVEELVERSKQNTEGIVALVRSEVQNQVSKLGLVPKAEVDALKRELSQLRSQQPKTSAAKAPAAKAAKKAAPAKKAVKKTVKAAKKSPAAKKSTAAKKR